MNRRARPPTDGDHCAGYDVAGQHIGPVPAPGTTAVTDAMDGVDGVASVAAVEPLAAVTITAGAVRRP